LAVGALIPGRPKDHSETVLSRDTGCVAKSSERKAPEARLYPMDLHLGDLLADERSEWGR